MPKRTETQKEQAERLCKKIDKLRADNKVLRDALEKAHSFDVAGMTYFDGYYQLKIILDEAIEKTKEAHDEQDRA